MMRWALPIVVAAALAGSAPAAADFTAAGPQLIQIGQGTVEPLALAGNDRGDRVVVYATQTETLRVAYAPAGQPFGEPRDVAESTRASDVQAAIGPTGDALIAWRYFDGFRPSDGFTEDCCPGVKAALVNRAGAVGGPATLWPRGTVVLEHRIAIRDRRAFGVAATIHRPAGGDLERLESVGIQARISTRRGGWGPSQHVAATGIPRALSVTESGAHLVREWSNDLGTRRMLVEHVRPRTGRWGRARRLFTTTGPSPRVAIEPRGGAIVASSVASSNGTALRVGTVRAGRPPRLRVVDRSSRRPSEVGGGIVVAANGTALLTWRTGDQWYRSERPAGRGFGPRRPAFIERAESTPYGFAVNSRGRWVAGILAGGRFADDHPRVRAIVGRFGARPSGSQLVRVDYQGVPIRALPPVVDRSGRITFVEAAGGSLFADTGN